MGAWLGAVSATLAAIASYWNWQGAAEKHWNASKGYAALSEKACASLFELRMNEQNEGNLQKALQTMKDLQKQNEELLGEAPLCEWRNRVTPSGFNRDSRRGIDSVDIS